MESFQRIFPFFRFIATVNKRLSESSKPVRNILSFTMHGDDHPGKISVFQSRFVSALKWMGGSAFSGAIPDALGPLNWSQCMDSAWNLYRPFDPVSKELRLKSKTIQIATDIKNGKDEKLKKKRSTG